MRTRRPAMRFGALVLIGLTTTGCLADKLMLWPPSGPVETNGAGRRVESGIEIWTVPPEDGGEPDSYVLSFYGNGARADWQVASDASHLPRTTFWGVNYRGYGGSEGSATLSGVADAATIAYDALVREAKGRPIHAFGTSMGTTAALHLAAERDVAGLLLVNPPRCGASCSRSTAGGTCISWPCRRPSAYRARSTAKRTRDACTRRRCS